MLLSTLLLNALTTEASINPPRSVYSFLDIFSSKNYVVGETVIVKATAYDESGDLIPGKKGEVPVPLDEFKKLRSLSEAVFQVIPSRPAQDDVLYQGTAFHIGHNLVLTNNHVLSRDFSNTKSCDSFRIKDHSDRFFNCSKVHFCHAPEDICLIEVSPRKGGLFGTGPRAELADLPALKLNYRLPESQNDALITSIGNSQGHGIHVSVARGVLVRNNAVTSYAAIRDGNSGGPVLNDQGEVIGVVRTESRLVKLEGGKHSLVEILSLLRQIHPSAKEDIIQALIAARENPNTKNEKDTVLIEKMRRILQDNPAALTAFNEALPKTGAVAQNHAASSFTVINLIREALKHNPETLGKFNQSVIE